MANPAGTAGDGKVVPIKGSGAHALPNGPSDDQIRAYIKDLGDVDAKIKVLADVRKTIRANANLLGIPLGRLDQRLKKQLWSPEDIREEWQWDLRLAEILGQPIGRQLELYGSAETPDALKEAVRWRQIGRSHGLAGKGDPTKGPDGIPPECVQPYGEGWREGQDETQQAYLRAHEKPAGAKPS